MSTTFLAPGGQEPSGLRAWLVKLREPALIAMLLGGVGTGVVYGGNIVVDATHVKDEVGKVSEHVSKHEARIDDLDRAERTDAQQIAAIAPELRSLRDLLQAVRSDAQQTDQRIIEANRAFREDMSRRLDTMLTLMRDPPRR